MSIRCVLMALTVAPTLLADEGQSGDASSLVDRIMRVTDVVMTHHIEPPVRQQMILGAVSGVYNALELDPPPDISPRLSNSSTQQLRTVVQSLLADVVHDHPGSVEQIESAATTGLLAEIRGMAILLDADELEIHKGSEKFRTNTYIGIGIALSHDRKRNLPVIGQVLEGGSAEDGGAKAGDLIERIDGSDAHGIAMTEAVKLLRGSEGSILNLMVRQPDSDELRGLKIVRRIFTRELVDKYRTYDGGIAYVHVSQIGASTLHELRKIEHRARQEGCRAIVLDMRGCKESELHYAVLLADGLIDEGAIGNLLSRSGVKEYAAGPECLFDGWAMATLVDNRTSGHASWIASALESNDRSRVLGELPPGNGLVYATVPVAEIDRSVILATGKLVSASRGPRFNSFTPQASPDVDAGDRRRRIVRGGRTDQDLLQRSLSILRTELERTEP